MSHEYTRYLANVLSPSFAVAMCEKGDRINTYIVMPSVLVPLETDTGNKVLLYHWSYPVNPGKQCIVLACSLLMLVWPMGSETQKSH